MVCEKMYESFSIFVTSLIYWNFRLVKLLLSSLSKEIFARQHWILTLWPYNIFAPFWICPYWKFPILQYFKLWNHCWYNCTLFSVKNMISGIMSRKEQKQDGHFSEIPWICNGNTFSGVFFRSQVNFRKKILIICISVISSHVIFNFVASKMI